MAVQKLNHVNMRASRALLDDLKNFYTQVLGLHLGERPSFAVFGYWLYAGDTAVVHLQEAQPDEIHPPHTPNTLDHVAFDATDRPSFEATLVQHDIAYQVAWVPNTNQVQLFFQDPAGNRIEVGFFEPMAT
jgi:catechol 2,3-dioxygenase-like lactoylglutathione lyase family enzyme